MGYDRWRGQVKAIIDYSVREGGRGSLDSLTRDKCRGWRSLQVVGVVPIGDT